MIYIVTGVSRGLGKAIAEYFLSKGESVIGVGRSHSIEREHFRFLECDLSDSSMVEALTFPAFDQAVTLINNAGIIGNIQRLSDQRSIDLANVLQVNTVAPQVLTNKIYNSLNNKEDFTLVNISSGAARRAIPSWAAYCASKAALNMLSETFYLEEQEKGNDCKVYCVAPGVIDTGMQEQIRAAGQEDFSSVGNFVALKEENKLFSPEEAARRLGALLESAYSGEIFYDLREV